MSQNLATIKYGAIFLKSFRREVEQARDEAFADSAKIVRREEEASIRQRWYRTGATLESLEEEVIVVGDKKTYRLVPSTFYAIFGEYGTGARGSRTGKPAPRGWKYGTHEKGSMAARRYSRIAVGIARPQVNDVFRQRVRELAANLTR